MYAFPIQPFAVGQLEKRAHYFSSYLDVTWMTREPETIASTKYIDVETMFYLSQMLIKLAAKIGQAFIIGGF
jgi:hypothetical protein